MSRFTFSTILVLALSVVSQQVLADDFRVETKVTAGKELKVLSENLTLFQSGRVYDFLTQGGSDDQRISIFDPRAGRMVLLDPARRIRTELKCERLIELTGSLKAWAAGQQADPLLKFSADPKFAEAAGATDDELTFSSDVMTYRVRTQKAPTKEAAKQYWEFSDAYARLNSATSPGSIPPFPRLSIDETLGKRDLVPKEVERTIPARGRLGGKPTVNRSEHLFHWKLLDSDQRRIDDAAGSLVTYSQVDLDEYLRTAAEATKVSANTSH